MQLTAEHVEALSGIYLSPRYDEPKPTPDFHRECWKLYCSSAPFIAVAAPRGHAKSTALTHDYILANVLFRTESHVLLLSSSEELAVTHLGDISAELKENDDLIRHFRIKRFVVERTTEVVVECEDGYQFRILARGEEQKIRGMKWRGRRPGLIVGDDLEEDEQVESKDRRKKLSRWFFRACIQARRTGGKVRVHGTILHDDSLLNSLMHQPLWQHKLFKAHKAFDDFSEILWPEAFPEAELRFRRQQFIDKGDPAGYSQEYLNDPFDYDDTYLRKEDFIPMSDSDYEEEKIVCAAADFAVSKLDSANRTSFTIGGKDYRNLLHVIDQRVGRWDYLEIIEEMFSIQERWHPDIFWVEDGVIWKTIAPTIKREMLKRDIWISLEPIPSTKDKAVRGRSLQKRMRAGGMRFDAKASWYPGFEAELLRFTGETEATLDDQFDSASLLSRGFEEFREVEEDDFDTEDELYMREQSELLRGGGDGRSKITGY